MTKLQNQAADSHRNLPVEPKQVGYKKHPARALSTRNNPLTRRSSWPNQYAASPLAVRFSLGTTAFLEETTAAFVRADAAFNSSRKAYNSPPQTEWLPSLAIR